MTPPVVFAIVGRLIELVAAAVAITLTSVSLVESIVDLRHVAQRRLNGWKLLVAKNAVRAEAIRLGMSVILIVDAMGMLWFDTMMSQDVDWTVSPFIGVALAVTMAVATVLTRRFRRLILEYE